MVGKVTETDKDVLKRVMREPTFAKIAEEMRKENAKRLRSRLLGDSPTENRRLRK